MKYRREIQGDNLGFIFKSYDNFVSGKGVCYLPEFIVGVDDEEEWVDEKWGYTRENLECLCVHHGWDKAMAWDLFESLDWQHPSTLILEWNELREEDDNEKIS